MELWKAKFLRLVNTSFIFSSSLTLCLDRTFSHLPHIHEVDGLLNFLSVAILVVFGNVLDFRTYSAPNQHESSVASTEQTFLMASHDINAIPFNERLAISYARGVALHVIRWIRDSCEVKGPDGKVVEDLPSIFMVQLLSALLAYKSAAQRRGLQGVPHCTFDLVFNQVENVVKCDPLLALAWRSRPREPSTSLALESKELYSVKWKEGWEEKWRSMDLGMLLLHFSMSSVLFILKITVPWA